MPRFDNPFEALLSGLGGGFQEGLPAAARAKREQQDALRRMMSQMRAQTAAQSALSREGSAEQQMDVFAHLMKPPQEQQAAGQALADMMANNPQLKSAQQLFGPAAAGETDVSVGIPQLSESLRQLQSARLLPQTDKAKGIRRAPVEKAEKERDVARETLTDLAKTYGIIDSIFKDQVRTDPKKRAAFAEQLLYALASANLPDPSPERLAVLVAGAIGPEPKAPRALKK